MRNIEYFDYVTLAKKIKVPENILRRVEAKVKEEFPLNKDKSMYGLHVLRTVDSGYWKAWLMTPAKKAKVLKSPRLD